MRDVEIIYNIGDVVRKISGKPFKSGSKTNTINNIVEHPYKISQETNKGVVAYTFEEDDSIVEAAICIKIQE